MNTTKTYWSNAHVVFTGYRYNQCQFCKQWVDYPLLVNLDPTFENFTIFCTQCIENLNTENSIDKSTGCDVCEKCKVSYTFHGRYAKSVIIGKQCMLNMYANIKRLFS